MANATALYYKYSRVLYTDSRIMYIAKFKNPTRASREKQNRIDCRIITNCSTNYNHQLFYRS